MADNNYAVEDVGGLQKLICAACGQEISREESIQYRTSDSKRVHYPSCPDVKTGSTK